MTVSPKPINPYEFSKPIRNADDFYGRSRQLSRMFERIRKRGSVNLMGERRSGKTSLLYHLLNPEVQRRYLPEDDDGIYVYIDPRIIDLDPGSFFAEIFGSAKEAYPDLAIEGDQPTLDERQVRRYLARMAPKHLVVLIDGFEMISECDAFPIRFYDFLRGIADTFEVTFIVVTRGRLADCCPIEVTRSPWFNLFQPIEMGAFAESEYLDFIERSSAPSGVPMVRVQDSILDMAGLLPYLIQIACWHFFQAWGEYGRFDMDVRARVQSRYEKDAQPHFHSIWRHLEENERETLLQVVNDCANMDPHIVWRLQDRGLMRGARAFSVVFADFVRAQGEGLLSRAPVAEILESTMSEPRPKTGIYVDMDSGDVYLDGQLLPALTGLQFALMRLLWENEGKICDKYQVVEAVWGSEYIDQVDDARIAALFTRLRRQVEPQGRPWRHIKVVYGRGWRLDNSTPDS